MGGLHQPALRGRMFRRRPPGLGRLRGFGKGASYER
jgi:hypothetical protein